MAYFGRSNDTGVYTPESRDLQMQQISPQSGISAIPSGAQITFKFMSNAVQQWVPSQSYFVIKLKLLDGQGTPARFLDTRFRPEHINEYFFNRLFTRISHTANGVRIASNDSPGKLIDGWSDANSVKISNESHMGPFNKDAFTDHFLTDAGVDYKTGETATNMENAGAARTHVTGLMRPQMSLWDLPYAVVTGENVISLVPVSGGATGANGAILFKSLNASAEATSGPDLSVGRHLGTGRDLLPDIPAGGVSGPSVMTRETTKYFTATSLNLSTLNEAPKISIEGIHLMVAYATPQVPMMMPPMGTHRLTTSNVQEISLNSASVNQTLTVPSSTFYLQAYVIDDADEHSRAKGAISFFASRVKELQFRLAGSNYPTLPYETLNSLTDSDAVRCYADSTSARNRLDPDASYPKNLAMWLEKPVVSFNIFRAQNNTDTQLHVRCNLDLSGAFGANTSANPAHKLVIVAHYNELLGIEYANQEPVAIDLQAVV